MVLTIQEVVRTLEAEYGNPDWWPAETPFEVAVGAILTQRTSWANVETSLETMRNEGLLTPSGLLNAGRARVERAIRPSGFYRQKADYLLKFASYVVQSYDGDILRMSKVPSDRLRAELLGLRGIGPETADSILLYALGIPSFVVDAYTVRVLDRLGIDPRKGYDSIKRSFEEALENNSSRLPCAHALLVVHCKARCRTQPKCEGCPLLQSCSLESE